ncbi:MAG: HAD family hydrolase [Ornithinimicrobium sp.]
MSESASDSPRQRGPIEAVIFDWGGTLTPWHSVDVAAVWASTYAACAFADDQGAADRLAAALVTADARASAQGREHHRSSTIEQIVAQASSLADVALERVDTTSAARAYAAAWEPHTFTDPHVGPLWRWLHEADIKVGVLSNTIWSREYHRGLFERDGVLDLIDGDVYTSEIACVKPHAEAFRLAAASVDADPACCIYVGDRLYEDIWGPAQVGMSTIHVPHSDIPAEQRVEIAATPDATVQSLAEVADIVSAWLSQRGAVVPERT